MILNKKPKVSVIMPFYNCEKYLDKAISSILNQTFQDFEFIIINDASTDRSDTVVKKYFKDERIIYLKNDTNLGVAQSLNKGITVSQGDFIAIMHGDDIATIDRLSIQYNYMLRNPNVGILGSYVNIIDENDRIIKKRKIKPLTHCEIKNAIFRFTPVISPTMFVRSVVFDKIGLFREKLRRCEDYEFLIRALFNNIQINNINVILLSYRTRKGQLSANQKSQVLTTFKIIKEYSNRYHFKLSITEYLIIYVKTFFGLFFGKEVSGFLQSVYKKLFYGE